MSMMLMYLFVGVPLVLLLLYLSVATFYLLALAVSYLLTKERYSGPPEPVNRFAVIVPAHNEELLVGTLCQSLLAIEYPEDKFCIYIVADNCSDGTVLVCEQYAVHVLERHNDAKLGKGHAIGWALKQIDLNQYDAVFMVDADNYVDANVLSELNCLVNREEVAIQCYNAVGNRNDSWFTQLLYVSRTIGNQLYHEAKERLGLSSYLMGNGLCFRSDLLKTRGWTAFSVGEDWEYYAQLVEDGIRIGFAAKAKVFHQESRSLNQATSQRLRWSSGRFNIAKKFGVPLLVKGIRQKDWRLIDSSLPLLLPNYSLQINLTLMSLAVSFFLPDSTFKIFLQSVLVFLVTGQLFLFLAGSVIAGSLLRTLKATLYVPFFLVWKAIIDILCVTGFYRGKKWVRTKRHKPTT